MRIGLFGYERGTTPFWMIVKVDILAVFVIVTLDPDKVTIFAWLATAVIVKDPAGLVTSPT